MRVSEYYDLFEFNKVDADAAKAAMNHYNRAQNAAIVPTDETNPFVGFWNDDNFNAGNPNNIDTVRGKAFSSLTYNNVYIEDDGTINCIPPTVSVPYWSKIIFRNFDYGFGDLDNPNHLHKNWVALGSTTVGTFEFMGDKNPVLHDQFIEHPIPENITVVYTENDQTVAAEWVAGTKHEYKLWGVDTSTYAKGDQHAYPDGFPLPFRNRNFKGVNGYATGWTGSIFMTNFEKVPLFLKYDEYPSQSKVIFSRCDKTRNPDIEFNFNNQHGQSEPVKLYLSLSASKSGYDSTTHRRFNTKLTKKELKELLNSCYWCIEWVYEPERGN